MTMTGLLTTGIGHMSTCIYVGNQQQIKLAPPNSSEGLIMAIPAVACFCKAERSQGCNVTGHNSLKSVSASSY